MARANGNTKFEFRKQGAISHPSSFRLYKIFDRLDQGNSENRS
jgi:hypothetical protein